jgi:HEAT repeat protein
MKAGRSDLMHRATPDLLAEALALSQDDLESDLRWQLIHELHRRGTEDVFAAAKQLSEQSDAPARELGADILCQLGELKYRELGQARPFTEQSVPILRSLLTDQNDRVVGAAIAAIGQHYRNAVLAEMPSLASHPSLRVRLSAAKTVRPQHEGLENPTAIEMLIRLSEDEDDTVRNWATFSLGSQGDLDTPEIREALHRRLSDSDFDARSEALIALAERKDRRVIPFIAAALESETVGALAVEAAGAIGSPDLLPPLLELRSWWDVDTALLESAIRNCGGAEQ